MKLHAAILEGPNGQFAVLRARPDEGESPVNDEQRRAAARCFKAKHGNIPVAFLASEPTGMRLLGYEDATGDLEDCLRAATSPATEWQDFIVDA